MHIPTVLNHNIGMTIYGMIHDQPSLVLQSLQEGSYVNIRTPGGWNPLIYASFYGS